MLNLNNDKSQFQWACQLITHKDDYQSLKHTNIELNYVALGRIAFQHCVDEVPVHAGEMVICWKAVPHRLVDISPDIQLYTLVIPLTTFLIWSLPNNLLSIITDGQLLKFDHISLKKRCDLLFNSWQDEINALGTTKQNVAIREVEAFIRRLALHTPVSTQLPLQTDGAPRGEVSIVKVQKMAEYIARHYTNLITVDQIAQSVSLNPNYAMTLFRKHFDQSVMDYLTKFRVAHAQRLLLFSDKPIDTVAQQSGFGSTSQFYATFKQTVGTTPNRYRHLA